LTTTKGPPPDEVDKLFRDYFLWKLKNNPQKATAAGFVEFSDQVKYFVNQPKSPKQSNVRIKVIKYYDYRWMTKTKIQRQLNIMIIGGKPKPKSKKYLNIIHRWMTTALNTF